MNSYQIVYSDTAKKDLDDLFQAIVWDYKAPLTAYRYVQGIIDTIKILSRNPESYLVQTQRYYSRHAAIVRRINYKKMAIIYSVHSKVVYIHRIVAASTIKDL